MTVISTEGSILLQGLESHIGQTGSKHYPAYSLNVASMWLKLGRLYMGLEHHSAGAKALRKALAIMEVVHGKDHPYIFEIQKELEEK